MDNIMKKIKKGLSILGWVVFGIIMSLGGLILFMMGINHLIMLLKEPIFQLVLITGIIFIIFAPKDSKGAYVLVFVFLLMVTNLQITDSAKPVEEGRTYLDWAVMCNDNNKDCYKEVKVCSKTECHKEKEAFTKEYTNSSMACTFWNCYKEVKYCSSYTNICESEKEVIY